MTYWPLTEGQTATEQANLRPGNLPCPGRP
jgi:hypothetical protein